MNSTYTGVIATIIIAHPEALVAFELAREGKYQRGVIECARNNHPEIRDFAASRLDSFKLGVTEGDMSRLHRLADDALLKGGDLGPLPSRFCGNSALSATTRRRRMTT